MVDQGFKPIPDEYVPAMPLTFTRYSVHGMPKIALGDSVNTILQMPLRRMDSGPASRIVNLGMSESNAYVRYRVEHEMQIDCLVRIDGDLRTRIKKIVVFKFFVNTIDASRVWFQTKKAIADEFLRRLRSTGYMDLSAVRHEIDVVGLVRSLEAGGLATEEIVSGWFINLNIPKVKTAMLQGPDVTNSADWKRNIKKGDLASIDIVRPYSGERLRTIVTKRGTIVFRKMIGEGIALELLDGIAERFAPFSKPQQIKSLKDYDEEEEDEEDGAGYGEVEYKR
jgi:hypothetical protein